MNKIDFPLGVELPLRGGGVAVLYEQVPDFKSDTVVQFGKLCAVDVWAPAMWRNGRAIRDGADYEILSEHRFDILPPKRKAWVVWCEGKPAFVHARQELAREQESQLTVAGWNGVVVQEITEP